MTTIEERAKEGCLGQYSPKCWMDGYIKGATEQKAKMIEKAYQWICESITLYVTCNEEDGYIIDYDEMRKDFFKEMEE